MAIRYITHSAGECVWTAHGWNRMSPAKIEFIFNSIRLRSDFSSLCLYDDIEWEFDCSLNMVQQIIEWDINEYSYVNQFIAMYLSLSLSLAGCRFDADCNSSIYSLNVFTTNVVTLFTLLAFRLKGNPDTLCSIYLIRNFLTIPVLICAHSPCYRFLFLLLYWLCYFHSSPSCNFHTSIYQIVSGMLAYTI